MPVIVIGADSTLGHAVVGALEGREGELRAFVTDPAAAARLKDRGVKAALGDVSDASHIAGAALQSFSAVLLPEAALDERERAFASTPDEVIAGWAEAVAEAGVRRVIYVEDHRLEAGAAALAGAVPEVAVVPSEGRGTGEIAADVARLDDAAEI
jgi:nucleoside-diphosphate-sugar epimerase